jgi:dipeptidyl aminopeptidase/acylaminoacyl peptidase
VDSCINRRATVNSRVYGRSCRDRLDLRWGIIDVEDCEGGRHLIVVGCADPDRLMISGGSAGD